MPRQHGLRGLHRARIKIDSENPRGAEPPGRRRVQAGAAADIDECAPAQRVRPEQANEAVLRLLQPILVDQGGVVRPVLTECEVRGRLFPVGRDAAHESLGGRP